MDEKELATAKQVGLGLGKVADTLDAHKAKNGNIEIDMDEAYINHCGSPMCFAGLYAVASKSKEELQGELYYNIGAELIAKESGLGSADDLAEWASENPKLWGNKYGIHIFGYDVAFGEYEEKTLTLNEIIAHLRKVSSNCASV